LNFTLSSFSVPSSLNDIDGASRLKILDAILAGRLYARTGDSRRDQQSHRFDEIKNIKEQRDRQMMRVIEIRPTGWSNEPK